MSTTDRFEIVRFRDQPLLCLERGEGIWVAMRPVVEGMGLDWKSQHVKLAGRAELFCVVIITTQIPGDDQRREHAFIPLERLFGWLMTVSHTETAARLGCAPDTITRNLRRMRAAGVLH